MTTQKGRFAYTFSVLACSLALVLSGCAGSSTDVHDPNQPINPTNPDPSGLYELTAISSQALSLAPGQQATIQARYTRGGQPVIDAVVGFAFTGDARDASLSTYAARTNVQGFAETVVTAGQQTGSFRIEAKAPSANPVQWTVTVGGTQTSPNGTQVFGTINLTSNFDIQTSFSGSKLGDALNMINDMTNDPQDPAKFIVDLLLDKVNNSVFRQVAMVVKPSLYVEVQKILMASAPTLIGKLKQIGADLSTIARKFELHSTIVSSTPQDANRSMSVTHGLKKIAWNLNGRRAEYAFEQLQMKGPEMGIQMSMANTTDVSIAQHTFEIKLGAFLLAALNNLVIPAAQPGAFSLTDVLKAHVNCSKVGTAVNSTVKIGGELIWSSACEVALGSAATAVETLLVNVDKEATKLTVQGTARISDTNSDTIVDQLDNGVWTGSLTLSKATAVITGQANTFSGKRVQ